MTTNSIALTGLAPDDVQFPELVLLATPDTSAGTPLLPPVITNVYDDTAAVLRVVSHEGSTMDQLPLITGTSEPGTIVVLSDNGVVIGQSVTDDEWQWSLQPESPLAVGMVHNFVASATQVDTGATTLAADPFQVLVEPQPLAPPVITAIMALKDDVVQQMVEGGQTLDMHPVLYGTSEPHSIVAVYDNGLKIGETVAGDDWSWSFTPVQAVAVDAFHAFTVVASHADGSSPTPSVWAATCTVGAAPNPLQPPVITAVSDDSQDHSVEVLPNGISADTTPELYGTSEPGSIVTILDGESVVGHTIAAQDWSWSFTPSADLSEGVPHQLHVAATRSDGSGLTYGNTDYPLWIASQDAAAQPVNPGLDTSGSLDQLLLGAGLPATAQTSAVAGSATAIDASSLAVQGTVIHQAAVPEWAY